ncbi:MAG: TlpA disulfide reductase family protein [Acidimicrobiia bacterium]|nr:TlpA disulfide reductase family protein [Acidimicrobiia bacterium]
MSKWQTALSVLVLVAACGGTVPTPGGLSEELPTTTPSEFQAHLATLDKPAVVNVWASWCLPCRAEAPLLNLAFEKYGDEIEFIGIDVQDTQSGAARFLAEFGLPFQHFFDPRREVVNHYGGIGTPVTMFFGPDGELIRVHNGIVDERTLAVNIDDLLSLGG